MTNTAHDLYLEALEEDKREHSRFDAIGFAQFFPEEPDNEKVYEAWLQYKEHWYGLGVVI